MDTDWKTRALLRVSTYIIDNFKITKEPLAATALNIKFYTAFKDKGFKLSEYWEVIPWVVCITPKVWDYPNAKPKKEFYPISFLANLTADELENLKTYGWIAGGFTASKE